MRVAAYFFRSRRTARTLLLLALSSIVGWFSFQQVGAEGDGLYWALVSVPLLPAILIGVGTRPPFDDIEGTSSSPIPLLRAWHMAALVCMGAVVTLVALTGFSHAGIGTELFRNLAGLTGIALLGARLLGSDLSWVAPLAYTMIGFVVGSESRLGWLIRYPYDTDSLVIAGVLLAAGLLSVTLQSPRTSPGEA